MNYTVNEVSKLAEISIRTLHHYDKIGLLKPCRNESNGYRFYNKNELIRLQQILFFRELNFPLKEIKQILDSKNFNRIEALKDQKKMLQIKQKRLAKLITTISNTISNMNKKDQDQELFDGFTHKEQEAYQEEAKKRWGNTKAWKQSQERLKNLSPKAIQQIKKEGEEILKEIAHQSHKGATSTEVQKAISKYHKHMNKFYNCSKDMFYKLGKIYSEDKRFKKTFENIKVGFAKFMTDAIKIYCKE